jgi:hypothetical protein
MPVIRDEVLPELALVVAEVPKSLDDSGFTERPPTLDRPPMAVTPASALAVRK